MQKSQELQKLQELLEVPNAKRDEVWEDQLLELLPEARLELLSQDPQEGPDGWPYLMAKISESEDGEPCDKVLNWLSDKGIGLVINPQKTYPDAVVSYGMAWSFAGRGKLKQSSPEMKSDVIEFAPGQKIYTRAPDESYLPEPVRKILKQFLIEQGVLTPRVLLISFDRETEDFCFSLQSLGDPPEEEHEGILEALSWFLPTDYMVGLVDERELPEFVAL